MTKIAYETNSVISKDGTKIGYRYLGSGPGIILLHGGMQYSENFMDLAGFLADAFTLYIPDRRGRGLSGPHSKNSSLLAESEDIRAIVEKTKAENIFGLSAGALVALKTALTEPALKKIALYEPPIPVNGTQPAGWADKYEAAMAEGNFGKAFINIVKGTVDSSLLSFLPGFITSALMNYLIKADAKKPKGENEVSLMELLPTIHYDIKSVHDSEGMIASSKNLKADVLLLGGSKSQDFLKKALDALSAALPKANRVEFKGLGHIAADNSGKPDVVAKELRRFFAAKI